MGFWDEHDYYARTNGYGNNVPDARTSTPNFDSDRVTQDDLKKLGYTPLAYPTNKAQFDAWVERQSRGSNQVATSVQQEQVTTAAGGAPIRIVYGERLVGAQLLWFGTVGADLVLQPIWCLGEIDSVESFLVNDVAPISDSLVTATHYTGTTTQTANTLLKNTIAGYNNPLIINFLGQQIGVCYSVIRISPSAVQGFPKLTAWVKGRKVYDPRDNTQSVSDKSTWKWSNNPSLCLADFETSKLYGRGRNIDWSSVADAADANDDLLNNARRRTLSLTIETRADVNTYMQALAKYANVFLSSRGSTTILVPDRPKVATRSLTASDIQNLQLSEPELNQKPTVVTIGYTDNSTGTPMDATVSVKLPDVDSGLLPWREQVLRMPGIPNHEEAYRFAVEQLNALNIINLQGEFITRDTGIVDEVGDVLLITHPRGLNNKLIQITNHQQVSVGRWRTQFIEYDAGRFSDDVVSGPNYTDTILPNPLLVPSILNLAVVEDVYQNENGIYASRLRATWDKLSNYPYRHQFRYGVYIGETLVWQGIIDEIGFITASVQEKVTYTVSVVATNPTNLATSAASIYTITAQGKYLLPSDVPQITAIQTGASTVKLNWLPAVDIDIWRYEVREGVTWNSANFINQADSLELTVTGVSAGSHTYLVKAIDSVRQYSVNAASVTLTLSAPMAPASLSGIELGGEVRLSWLAGTGFISGYEVRYGAVGFSWANGKVIDRISALRLTTKDVAAGTWDFLIRAVDDAGNYSSNEARVTVTVTLDAAAFIADSADLVVDTVSQMAGWSYRPENEAVTTYVTDMGDSIASLFPNAMSSYTDPLVTYHSSGASEWLSAVHDFGLSLSGTWILQSASEAISGALSTFLELSTDNISWTQYNSASVKAVARYARVRIQSNDTIKITTPGISIRISVIPREESHTLAISSSGTTVTLDNAYAATQSIIITPMGTSAQTYAVDNIIMGDPSSFDVYLFNSSGALISGSALVTFKGV